MSKIFMKMTIVNKNGESIEIARSKVTLDKDILIDGRGGTRCYIDLPDMSIYNPDSTVSIDLYQLDPKVIEL